jgi:hypothetical protein
MLERILAAIVEAGRDLEYLAVWAALLAVLVAWAQLRAGRKESKARTAFEHLRDIEPRLQRVWGLQIEAVQKELTHCYRERLTITPGGADYLSFLNALDLAAYSARKGAADRSTIRQYTKSLVTEQVVGTDFIRELRSCYSEGGDTLYAELERVLNRRRFRFWNPRWPAWLRQPGQKKIHHVGAAGASGPPGAATAAQAPAGAPRPPANPTGEEGS